MLRALVLTALICVCGILPSSPATEAFSVKEKPSISTHNNADTMNASNMTPQRTIIKTTTEEVIDSSIAAEENNERYNYYHPVEHTKPHVIEQFDHRYLDGTYEFKYVLSNGVARYEKSYWKPYDKYKKLLARKGYYSYPLTNGKYITVFYTADERGYLQDSVKHTSMMPTLPKHLDIPQYEFSKDAGKPYDVTTTPYMTTRRTTKRTTTPRTTTTRKPTRTTTPKQLVEPTKFNWIY